MDLAAAWLLFPLVLLAVAAGCGLALDRAVGRYLSPALLLPLGFATAMALARLVTSSDATAELALPVLLVVAAAGLTLGRRRLRDLIGERHGLAVALAVFLTVGAPAYLTLEPTFLGYLQLPDTSHQLSLAAFYPESGPHYESLPDSSYRRILEKYISTDYPVAAQATLGVLAPLGTLDLAWLYHPFLAFLLAMAALSVYSLAWPVRSRALRLIAAFAGASPALVYSYALQGSIKEVAAVSMLLATVAAAEDFVTRKRPLGGLFAVFVPAAAMLGALGPAAAPYLAPVLAVPVVAAGLRLFRGRELRAAAAAIAAGVVALGLIAPILLGFQNAYEVNTGTLEEGTRSEDLGNLAAPLKTSQLAGIWLNGDYRYEPERDLARDAQSVLIPLVLLAAVAGIWWAVRRRAWGPALLVLGLGPSSLLLLDRGTAYADAKVLMLASPLALTLALFGSVLLFERRRLAGYALAAVLGGALLASLALAYHDSHPAPYERYSELVRINDRFNAGPALISEYDEFSQYFLRDITPYGQPEYPHAFREDEFRDPNGLEDPDHRPSLKTPLDLDDLRDEYVQSVPTLVLRRSPVMSRPPVNYVRASRGNYYEVWRRGSGRVTAHLPLGNNVFEPSAVPRCRDVLRLAAQARREGGELVGAARPRLRVFVTSSAPHPPYWTPFSLYPGSLVLVGAGRGGAGVTVPATARYGIWVEGSIGRSLEVSIDGREIGRIQYELGNPGQYLYVGDVSLTRGVHNIDFVRGGGDLRPGNGGSQSSLRHLGPLILSPAENDRPRLVRVSAASGRSLCGRRLDWVEVVAP